MDKQQAKMLITREGEYIQALERKAALADELAAALQVVMHSDRLRAGLTPAQFKLVWSAQMAALAKYEKEVTRASS